MALSSLKRYLFDSNYRFLVNSNKAQFMCKSTSDEQAIKKMYKAVFGNEIDLTNPKTFSEKLQWLKLNYRDPQLTTMVDKYAVKEYVSSIIGKQYIIPTLGVWDYFEQIDFDSLPNQFVLKCTHDSGGLAICRDKEKFNIDTARKKINASLKRNYYMVGREWPYKDVKPRIIAEKYMEDSCSSELRDYKFFCFNGEPKFLYLSEGLENHDTARISYVTLDWKQAEFYREDFPPFEQLPEKPFNFDKMLDFSRQLSKGIPFIRVDFYEVEKKLFFGELTLFNGSGLTRFVPNEWDKKLGDLIELPKKGNAVN